MFFARRSKIFEKWPFPHFIPTAWRQDDAEDVVQAKDLSMSRHVVIWCEKWASTWWKKWKTWVAGGKNEGPSAGKELMQRDLTTTCIAIGCGENRWRQCHLPSSKESSLIARVIHGWQVCTSLTNKADKIEKADVGIFWNPLSTLSIDWKFGATAPVDVLLWNAVEGQELLYTLIIIDRH